MPPLVGSLAFHVNAKVFPPNEICPLGALYIIHKGVALYRGRVYTQGQSWGEDLLMPDPSWCGNGHGVAVSYLQVYTLEGKIIKDCLTLYPDSSKLVKQVNMRWQMARMLIKAAKIVKKVQDGVGTALPRPASPIEMLDSQLKKKGAGSGSGSDDSDGLAAARRFAAREAVRAGAAKTVEERMDTVEKQLETVVGILKDISSRMGPRPSAGSRSNSPVNAPRSETWKMSNPMSA